jgi:hypothetical protein
MTSGSFTLSPPEVKAEGMVSVMAVPMKLGNRVIGVLCVATATTRLSAMGT